MLTFNKKERLKKQKDIDALFSAGKKIKENPVVLFWNERIQDDAIPFKMAFSVSQKQIKSAVNRNRIKRQMREIYRLQKNQLFEALINDPKKYAGMLIYTSTVMPEHTKLKEKIILILERYIEDIKSHNS